MVRNCFRGWTACYTTARAVWRGPRWSSSCLHITKTFFLIQNYCTRTVSQDRLQSLGFWVWVIPGENDRQKPVQQGKNSILIQQDIDGAHDFDRLPILRSYDLASEAALAVDQVRFGKHRRAIIRGGLLGGVAIGREDHMIVHEKLFVRVLVFVHADAKNDSAPGRDILLQGVERLSFFKARRTPRCPKIEDHDFAAQVGQMR